jgi:tetratricopeptide (TPR) repeat protein
MEQALRSGVESPEIHFALGNALFKRGEVPRAAEEYNRVLKMAPQHSGALFGSALVALKSGRTQEGVRLLEASRSADGSNLAARRNLAILYEEAGRHDDAIAEYRAILAMDPAATDIHFHLGEVYARAGRSVEARRELGAYLAAGDGQFHREAQATLDRIGK